MLTRLVVDLYAWVIEISLWFALLISGVVGYFATVPILNSAGAILENETVWPFYGVVFFALATFLISAVLIGPFLVLVDIRKSLRALEAKSISGSSGGGATLADVNEPAL